MSSDNTPPFRREISPEAAALVNTPKNSKSGLAPPCTGPLSPDDPTIAADVQDLDALLAPSLVPTELSFAAAQMAARAREGHKEHFAPKNFINAHLIIIDTLLMDPSITITKLSSVTGYSRSWLHKVMSSDAFQAKLAERQKAIIDPIIASTIKDRVQGLASRSLEIIEERMEADDVSIMTAMDVFSMTSKAMGLGQQKQAPVIAPQFIVHVPARMESVSDWAAQHSGRTIEPKTEILPLPSSEEPK